MLAMVRAGIPVTWTPMTAGHDGPPYYRPSAATSVGDPDLDPLCNRAIPYDVVIVHTVPEYFPSWVAAERGRPIVGHTVWETTAVPAHWPPLLNAVDRLFVPCHWNKTVFTEGGVTVPIDVIPHIAEATGDPAISGTDRNDGDGFVFYTIGVWTERKAVFRTVQAFCEAFTADDPVTLVIKTTPRDETVRGVMRFIRRTAAQAVRRITRRYRRPPRIRLITDVQSESEIRRLHARGDCYVSLCRCEGWGLGAFDAAAHGNPVVMTGFGGQLDYLDRDLAYLVGYELVPVINSRAPLSYSPDQRWAEPDVAHGARLLRDIAAHPGEARARGRALRETIVSRFGDRAVIAAVIPALEAALR